MMSNNFFDNLRQQLETANFPESQRAEKLLLSLAETDDERAALHRVLDALIHDLLDAPDALLSLLNLTNVADKVSNRGDFLNQLHDDQFRGRLCRVLSWAQSLADTLIRRSQLLDIVRRAPQEVSRPQLRVLAQKATQDFPDE